MNKCTIFIPAILLCCLQTHSQVLKTHDHSIALNFLQIKEEMNYGLVFRGPGLGYAYSAVWENAKRKLELEPRLDLSVPYAKGVIAASMNIVPLRFDYLFKTGKEGRVCVGPCAIAEYNYELYPDLQSGYSFWFTNFSLGGVGTVYFNLNKNRFDISLHTTLIGFTSRQPVYDDPYYFDLSLGDIVRFVHQDLQFGSFGSYNNSEIELRWTPNPSSSLAYGYCFQFYGYFNEPSLAIINQSVKLFILPKK